MSTVQGKVYWGKRRAAACRFSSYAIIIITISPLPPPLSLCVLVFVWVREMPTHYTYVPTAE